VSIEEEVRAYGELASGGSVSVSAPMGMVFVGGKKGRLRAGGGPPDGGGTITVSGATVDVSTITANGQNAPGGEITVTGGSVTVHRMIIKGDAGGSMDITSNVGSVTLVGSITADAKESTGGTLQVDAATDATITGPISLDGETVGGEARFMAGGNLAFGNSNNTRFEVDAPMGGVINGQAIGNISAQGRFSAETGGCIGLVAGGTLTTGLSTFSPALQTSPCP
jgi:hypothetical protein